MSPDQQKYQKVLFFSHYHCVSFGMMDLPFINVLKSSVLKSSLFRYNLLATSFYL